MPEPICKDCAYFKAPGLAALFGDVNPRCKHPACRHIVTGAPLWCKTARLLKCELGQLFVPAPENP